VCVCVRGYIRDFLSWTLDNSCFREQSTLRRMNARPGARQRRGESAANPKSPPFPLFPVSRSSYPAVCVPKALARYIAFAMFGSSESETRDLGAVHFFLLAYTHHDYCHDARPLFTSPSTLEKSTPAPTGTSEHPAGFIALVVDFYLSRNHGLLRYKAALPPRNLSSPAIYFVTTLANNLSLHVFNKSPSLSLPPS
jgi:hypothetical protein